MTPRTNRPPLTPERIVDAAIALADAGGLEGLTMRALARELGVEAMSIYHHVANREAILDRVVDRLYGAFPLPVVGAPWRAEMRRRSLGARAVVVRHPWAIRVMNSRRNPGAVTLQHLDAVIGCLRASGFSPAMTGHAFALLDAHLYGFLAQELSLPFSDPSGVAEMAGELASAEALAAVPHFAAFVAEQALAPGYDFGEAEFAWGLDVVLDALERARSAEGAVPGEPVSS